MTPLTVEERDDLAERMTSDVAPHLTRATHDQDAAAIASLLVPLNWQELAALAVVLATRAPAPPATGEHAVDELIARLRAARIAQGLTQDQVGARAGYCRNAVYFLESGRRGVRLETVADCATALGLRVTLTPADHQPPATPRTEGTR